MLHGSDGHLAHYRILDPGDPKFYTLHTIDNIIRFDFNRVRLFEPGI